MFSELLALPVKKSYQVSGVLSDKVREFDPLEHQVIHSGATHDRYNCPYCLEKRGKADEDGKLYWSRDKLISYCFKCETVGILKTDRDISEVRLQVSLNSLLMHLTSNNEVDCILSEIDYFSMFDPLDEEGKNFLNNRVPFYSDFADKLHFRVNPTVGVAVPLYINDCIVSYNLRFYNPPGKMKYYIPPGTKLLYSPNNVIHSRTSMVEITIVEGLFDAVGALLDGHPNPIAVFGKSITPLQISLIRKLLPIKINVYLDEVRLSYDLIRKIRDHFPTCSQYEVVPTRSDPEERLISRIKRSNSEVDMNSLVADINNAYSLIK